MKRSSACGTLLILFWLCGAIVGAELADHDGIIAGKVATGFLPSPEDVVVYLENIPGEFSPPPENPVMDQKNLIYTPHVLPLLVGTTVDFPNSDEVRHNVFSPSALKRFNLGTYPKGVVRHVLFDKPGVVTLLCNVHQEMSAYVVILENPYFAKTGRHGKFRIDRVPAGTYTIKTWHEKLKPATETVVVSDGTTTTVNFNLRR